MIRNELIYSVLSRANQWQIVHFGANLPATKKRIQGDVDGCRATVFGALGRDGPGRPFALSHGQAHLLKRPSPLEGCDVQPAPAIQPA